jgi:hypothetical protein
VHKGIDRIAAILIRATDASGIISLLCIPAMAVVERVRVELIISLRQSSEPFGSLQVGLSQLQQLLLNHLIRRRVRQADALLGAPLKSVSRVWNF